MKSDFRIFKHFITAMAATMLAAVAVGGILLALVRMENTMGTESYTLFSFERKPGNQIQVTALDNRYDIDLSGVKSASQELSWMGKIMPPGIRGFFETVNELTGQLASFFKK